MISDISSIDYGNCGVFPLILKSQKSALIPISFQVGCAARSSAAPPNLQVTQPPAGTAPIAPDTNRSHSGTGFSASCALLPALGLSLRLATLGQSLPGLPAQLDRPDLRARAAEGRGGPRGDREPQDALPRLRCRQLLPHDGKVLRAPLPWGGVGRITPALRRSFRRGKLVQDCRAATTLRLLMNAAFKQRPVWLQPKTTSGPVLRQWRDWPSPSSAISAIHVSIRACAAAAPPVP